jgi:hypothetical protein
VQQGGVELDAVGHRRERGRHLVVRGVGEADDRDRAAQARPLAAVEDRGRRHPRERPPEEVEARRRRQRPLAEVDRALGGDEPGRLLGRQAGQGQGQGLVVATAELDHQRHAPGHAVVVAVVVDRARGPSPRGDRRQGRGDGVGARHRGGAAHRLRELGLGEPGRFGRGRRRAIGGRADQPEHRAQDHHPGLGDRGRQRVVAMKRGDHGGQRVAGGEQRRARGGVGRGGAVGGLDLGGQRRFEEQLGRRVEQVEGDRVGLGGGQRPHQAGPAAPGLEHVRRDPAGLVVEPDDHDPGVAQRPRPAALEPPVEAALLEAVEAGHRPQPAVAGGQGAQGEADHQRDRQRPVAGAGGPRSHRRQGNRR